MNIKQTDIERAIRYLESQGAYHDEMSLKQEEKWKQGKHERHAHTCRVSLYVLKLFLDTQK